MFPRQNKFLWKKKELILKVFHYFESESKRGAPFYSCNNISKRTIHCLKISESLLKKLLRENSNDEEKERFTERKNTILDSFDKDLIKTVVFNLFSKNECICITLKKLKSYLEKNHNISISKYKLWKTLHELGFKYKKLSVNRKALVERNDIINQRINYLRTIKKKKRARIYPSISGWNLGWHKSYSLPSVDIIWPI